MSTDIDFSCYTQDSLGTFAQTTPGFSLAYGDTTAKQDNNPLNVVIGTLISNVVTSTDYNSGMYNINTGVITVPKTGIWILNQTYITESGNTPFVSYTLTQYIISGFVGPVQLVNTSDLLRSGLDASNGRSDTVYLTAGTTLSLSLEYTVVGDPGTIDIGVRFSMHLISELP